MSSTRAALDVDTLAALAQTRVSRCAPVTSTLALCTRGPIASADISTDGWISLHAPASDTVDMMRTPSDPSAVAGIARLTLGADDLFRARAELSPAAALLVPEALRARLARAAADLRALLRTLDGESDTQPDAVSSRPPPGESLQALCDGAGLASREHHQGARLLELGPVEPSGSPVFVRLAPWRAGVMLTVTLVARAQMPQAPLQRHALTLHLMRCAGAVRLVSAASGADGAGFLIASPWWPTEEELSDACGALSAACAAGATEALALAQDVRLAKLYLGASGRAVETTALTTTSGATTPRDCERRDAPAAGLGSGAQETNTIEHRTRHG